MNDPPLEGVSETYIQESYRHGTVIYRLCRFFRE